MLEHSDEHVWVALRVDDGSGAIMEYYGRMSTDQFTQITHNLANEGWIVMEKVTWDVNGQFRAQSSEGKNWGYSDVSYYRAYNIVRIVPLDEEFVLTKLIPLHEVHR